MVRVGVVGLGYWGPNLVRNFLENRNCSEVVGCDIEPEKLRRILQRYPQMRVTERYQDLLDDPTIEGIAISTPVSTHYELAKRALESGRAVFVEKPFTAQSEEALELIELSEKRGILLMVGHIFEYSPAVMKIKELIADGHLGEIHFITSSRVNLGLHRRDVSVIWDLASHDFSTLFYWLEQKPVAISATGRAFVQRGLLDVAFINLEFESGTIAHVEVSWLAPSKLRRAAIVGSEKMLVYDDTENLEKVKIYDKGVDYRDPETFGEYHLSYRTGQMTSPTLPNFEPLAAEVAHFLDCLEAGKRPRTDGWAGLRVVLALEAADRSARDGGRMEKIVGGLF